MLEININKRLLFQYAQCVPVGNTVTEYLTQPGALPDFWQTPVISILGCHGNLKQLNFTATFIMENLLEGNDSIQIVSQLNQRFGNNVDDARRISKEYVDFLLEMEKAGFIELSSV